MPSQQSPNPSAVRYSRVLKSVRQWILVADLAVPNRTFFRRRGTTSWRGECRGSECRLFKFVNYLTCGYTGRATATTPVRSICRPTYFRSRDTGLTGASGCQRLPWRSIARRVIEGYQNILYLIRIIISDLVSRFFRRVLRKQKKICKIYSTWVI